jgi:predicted regulator of Ras-like GTPase activity (Roadblock/LC7/MglB family)
VESEFERLRKKVENFPSASAYNRLAEMARLNGDEAEAERVCQRCIKEFPRNGQTYVILGEIAYKAQRNEDALKHFQAAVDRDPRSYTGHRLLADMHLANNNTGKALHHLRQILIFKPGDATTLQRIEALTKSSPQAAANGSAQPQPAKPGTQTVKRSANTSPNSPLSSPSGGYVIPFKTATAPANRAQSLQALCAEEGVKGAVVADAQGRVVISLNIPDGKADLVAALTTEVSSSAGNVLTMLGHERLASWLIEGEQGQVMAFKRDANLTLAVLAASGVRAALLELRARQILIDLGGP